MPFTLGTLSRRLETGFPIAIRRADGTGYLDSAAILAFRVKARVTLAVTPQGEFPTVRDLAWLIPRLEALGGWVPIGRNYLINLHQVQRIGDPKGSVGHTLTFRDGTRLSLLPGYEKPVRDFFAVEELHRIRPISPAFAHLLDMGAREVPTDIRFTPTEVLREIFSTVSGSSIVVSVLIASFLWQQACYIRKGKPSIVAGKNVRSLYYKIKPILDRLDVPGTSDHYKTLSEQMSEMVLWRILTYREFGLREKGIWSVGPYNPHIIVMNEKEADEDYLKQVQDLTGATFIATGGQPATITMEYFSDALRQKLAGLPPATPLVVIALTDYDPFGWTLKDTFLSHLMTFGLPRPTVVLDLAVPKNYDQEVVPFVKIDLTNPTLNIPPGMLRRWMKRTGGIDGEPFGLILDDFWEDTPHAIDLIRQAAEPYSLVPIPVPTRFWADTDARRQRFLDQATRTLQRLPGSPKPRRKH